MTRTPRVWVDYNALNEHDIVVTLREHLEGTAVTFGPIETFDGEGNECPGIVFGQGSKTLAVKVDRSKFREATP